MFGKKDRGKDEFTLSDEKLKEQDGGTPYCSDPFKSFQPPVFFKKRCSPQIKKIRYDETYRQITWENVDEFEQKVDSLGNALIKAAIAVLISPLLSVIPGIILCSNNSSNSGGWQIIDERIIEVLAIIITSIMLTPFTFCGLLLLFIILHLFKGEPKTSGFLLIPFTITGLIIFFIKSAL